MSENLHSSQSGLQLYINEEVKKVAGAYYPVKSGFLRRLLIRKAPVSKLHPNPYDEFSMPEIGPSMAIVSKYMREFSILRGNSDAGRFSADITANERIQVERIRPDGYIILNGHHRWAAAHQVGMQKVRIKILNLTQKKDILRALHNSHHDRRVTLDLDEIVFSPKDSSGYEKQLPFFLRRIYKERIRVGIPSLFQFLTQKGYDVWVYTSGYYSVDYLRNLFRFYHCPVAGVITGISRKGPAGADMKLYLEQIFEEKYQSTLHIDNEMVLQTVHRTREFRDYPLNLSGGLWSAAVMNTIRKLETENEK